MFITREEILHRSETIWPIGGVEYSQSTIHLPDGYRQDCSGGVSLCWKIPPGKSGGPNTVTLVTAGWMRRIPFADLRPGDALGLCGLGTAGDAGHIQLVRSYDHAAGLVVVWEQAGGPPGPAINGPAPIDPRYSAYRYVNVLEDDMSPAQAKDLWFEIWRVRGLQTMADPIVIPANPVATPDYPFVLAEPVEEPNELARAIRAGGGGAPAAHRHVTGGPVLADE